MNDLQRILENKEAEMEGLKQRGKSKSSVLLRDVRT